MAGIVHKRIVAPKDKGMASDWNDNHEITGNVDVEQHQFLNQVIENRTDWPAGPSEGRVIHRTDSHTFYIWDGSVWASIIAFNFDCDGQKIIDMGDPTLDQDAATKKYVDIQVAGKNEFLELIDTPGNYTDDGLKLVRVNIGETALEFVAMLDEDDMASDSNTDVATQQSIKAYVDDLIFGPSAVTPIGAVIAWLASYANTPALPDNWVECNGQTLSDADSPYNGQVIPDLNGDNTFLRGNWQSGGTGGAASNDLAHTHNVSGTTDDPGGHTHSVGGTTGNESSHTHSGPNHQHTGPSHNHSFSVSDSGDTGYESSHTHSFSDLGTTGYEDGTIAFYEPGTEGFPPHHDHDFNVSGTTGSGSSHRHSFSMSDSGNTGLDGTGNTGLGGTGNTGTGSIHSHSFSDTSDSQGGHTHSWSDTSDSKLSSTTENRPPYHNVVWVMRIK